MLQHHVTVYVGDVTEYLSLLAHRHVDAKHITSCNRQNLKPGVYYTSIGDLDSLVHFGEILQQADEIVYAPPDCWSDSGQMKRWTEDYLQVFACDPDKTIKGFVLETDCLFLVCQKNVSPRATEGQQIWIAGCSVSHGLGVQPHQRYGHIIGERFNLPVSYLTEPGASILWAADQILRSDIRPGDKIFWGLTEVHRLTYWDTESNTVRYSALVTWDRHKRSLSPIIKQNFFVSDHVIYQSVLAVRQVVNFCNKLGIEIVIATVMAGMESYLRDLKNFIPLALVPVEPGCWLDLGNDNEHPGPKSHEFYADNMINKYLKLYGIANKI